MLHILGLGNPYKSLVQRAYAAPSTILKAAIDVSSEHHNRISDTAVTSPDLSTPFLPLETVHLSCVTVQAMHCIEL